MIESESNRKKKENKSGKRMKTGGILQKEKKHLEEKKDSSYSAWRQLMERKENRP